MRFAAKSFLWFALAVNVSYLLAFLWYGFPAEAIAAGVATVWNVVALVPRRRARAPRAHYPLDL